MSCSTYITATRSAATGVNPALVVISHPSRAAAANEHFPRGTAIRPPVPAVIVTVVSVSSVPPMVAPMVSWPAVTAVSVGGQVGEGEPLFTL